MENNFALTMIFKGKFEFKEEGFLKRLENVYNGIIEVENNFDINDKEHKLFNIKIGGHKFMLVGIDAPISKDMQEATVSCAYGNREEVEDMKLNSNHIIMYHKEGINDINEICSLSTFIAYGFMDNELLGLLNVYSWNALTPSVINGLIEDEMLSQLRVGPTMMIWRNFLKIPKDNKVWFTTKGNNNYRVNEYAYLGTFEESEEVYGIFESIFDYQYENKVEIVAGHTIQLDEDVYLRFIDVYEFENILEGQSMPTLVIQKIRADEINK